MVWMPQQHFLKFQSTCPARGTTRCKKSLKSNNLNFNPRAPRGARPEYRYSPNRVAGISIHVPREGHDPLPYSNFRQRGYFNPRAPRGARHALAPTTESPASISIHVPREGHDYAREWANRMFLISIHVPREGHDSKHAQFLRANLRKSYNYPFERDALHAKNACKLINASS